MHMSQRGNKFAAQPFEPLVTEKRQVVFENAVLSIEDNVVRNSATSEVTSQLRILSGGESTYRAVIVPRLKDGRFVMLSRYRYAVGQWSIEFPRLSWSNDDGGWKDPTRTLLLTEVGIAAPELALLGAVHAEPAILCQSSVVILADECVSAGRCIPNATHLIAGVVTLSLPELEQSVRAGEVFCGVTLSALSMYQAWKHQRNVKTENVRSHKCLKE
jgi:hypothetical protein